ncbi:TetR/AcrR family transcriptional regulator [Nocardiopsis sp. RSe5-2]|uniref:TetR/AcrR family transcriptional regulator n=1 Tax=Nocardiopsis endophytica TaxID=3018445 RepID=A0ABT4TZ36_9ACTN|nr:TetR/AcrR family transcriptional regulator [Nocardiopsis endophytica]MDA2809495.1 TetR/AcrR family transcriptional regulator [Nocardiopsis endophytica]
MDKPQSLRERKKRATRVTLGLAALDLFEERGFDNVSVAEVADAADVSKKTVFNYFEVKEDLVLGFGAHHIGEPAEAVRSRKPGQTPLDAMRDYVMTALEERQPLLGLSDDPIVKRVLKLVRATPALQVRHMEYMEMTRARLAEALVEEKGSRLTARLVATQLYSTQQVLAAENARRVLEGESPDDVYPDAVANARHAFDWLERGFGDLLRRPPEGERGNPAEGGGVSEAPVP